MVASYTALRTHIRQIYGKSGVLVRGKMNGLLVQMNREDCSPVDIVCYGCSPTEHGVLFSLDSIGVKPHEKGPRLLPTTLNSFLSRCIKDGIEIKRQETHFQTTPQILSLKLDGDLILNAPSLLANYSTIDIVLREGDEGRLGKLNYVKSNKSEGVYRVFLQTSTMTDISTEDVLVLLSEVVKGEWEEEGWKWKGWSKEEVEKIVKEDMSPMLFRTEEGGKEDSVLEEGVGW